MESSKTEWVAQLRAYTAAKRRERPIAALPEAPAGEDRELDFHVSTWSRFAEAPPALLDQARALQKPIDASHTYFDHINGTLWAPRCGLQVENLWAWNCAELALVEEAIAHVRY